MANTAVITKQSVDLVGNGIYNVTIRMVVNDGATDIFDEQVSQKYNENAPDLNGVKQRIIEQLQARWDKYADEDGVFSAAAFDNMIDSIQTSANTYVNQ